MIKLGNPPCSNELPSGTVQTMAAPMNLDPGQSPADPSFEGSYRMTHQGNRWLLQTLSSPSWPPSRDGRPWHWHRHSDASTWTVAAQPSPTHPLQHMTQCHTQVKVYSPLTYAGPRSFWGDHPLLISTLRAIHFHSSVWLPRIHTDWLSWLDRYRSRSDCRTKKK